jgi:hypothetical protein
MLFDRPWFKPSMMAVWIVCLATLYYTLYSKFQFVAGCDTRLGQSQLIAAQLEQNEAQVKESEARLDAAEAQLDKAKR